jgi:preprotein translocase subunit YajC
MIILCPAGFRAKVESAMTLQRGDRVKTETGEVGTVVHISRLTIFVAFAVSGKEDHVEAFLESQLANVERGAGGPP